MCDCPFPICSVTADIYASGRAKRNGMYTVERWLDCLVHGVHHDTIEVNVPPNFMDEGQNGEWTKHKFTRVFLPAKKRETPRGKVKRCNGFKNL